jgi:hypothetical protein
MKEQIQKYTKKPIKGGCYLEVTLGHRGLRNCCRADISSDLALLSSAEFKFVNNLKESTQHRSVLNVFSAFDTFHMIFSRILAKGHYLLYKFRNILNGYI